MILVVAKLDVAGEHRDAFVEAARAAVAEVRAEEGCLAYDLHEDVERPGRFVFVEEYRDEAALSAHSGSRHLADFRAATRGMVEGAEIVVHEVASSRKPAR